MTSIVRQLRKSSTRDQVRRMAEDCVARLAVTAKQKPEPAVRWSVAPVDESGLTAEMRAHIAKGVGE
jgi:hypothetical protein